MRFKMSLTITDQDDVVFDVKGQSYPNGYLIASKLVRIAADLVEDENARRQELLTND